MKTLKFKTTGGRTYQIQFLEDDLLNYFKNCGECNLPPMNQVALYINNIHEKKFDIPYDSVDPQSIECDFSATFRKKYAYINDSLKYNL